MDKAISIPVLLLHDFSAWIDSAILLTQEPPMELPSRENYDCDRSNLENIL